MVFGFFRRSNLLYGDVHTHYKHMHIRSMHIHPKCVYTCMYICKYIMPV
jgi:hypothetical protein